MGTMIKGKHVLATTVMQIIIQAMLKFNHWINAQI